MSSKTHNVCIKASSNDHSLVAKADDLYNKSAPYLAKPHSYDFWQVSGNHMNCFNNACKARVQLYLGALDHMFLCV